jgi:lipid-A-disaccharide synthase-like uncharacterized protein
MSVLRAVLVTGLAGMLLWIVLGALVQGLRTGKMHFRDSRSVCDRASRPVLFWFLALLFGSFSILVVVAWLDFVFL